MCVDVAQNRCPGGTQREPLGCDTRSGRGHPLFLACLPRETGGWPGPSQASEQPVQCEATRLPRFRLRRAPVAFYVLPANTCCVPGRD